ncbi:Tetratricopeptide repeat protein 1 [Aphelenchoides besseyi]|nr:Tetratricopeptide repeat protein 1 [Aphelenchoides besseyi]
MSKKMDELKAQGNEQFKRGEYADAIKSYNSAIFIAQSKDKSEEERAAISILYSNASQAYINNKQYQEAVNSATDALLWDSKAQKALYRRALANNSLEKIDEAKADLTCCLELDPTNDEVLKLCKTFGFIDLIETIDESSNESGQGWHRAFIMAYFRQHLQEQSAKCLSGIDFETQDELQIPLFRMALLSSEFALTLQSLMSGTCVSDNELLVNSHVKVSLPSAFQYRPNPNVVFISLILIMDNSLLMALFHVIELTDFIYKTANYRNANLFIGVLKAKDCYHTKSCNPLLPIPLSEVNVLRGEWAKSITSLTISSQLIDPSTMSFPSLKTLQMFDFELEKAFLSSWAQNPSSLPIENLWLGVVPKFEHLSAFRNVCPTLKQVSLNCVLGVDPPSPFGLVADPQFRQKAEQLKAFAPNLKEVIATAGFAVYTPDIDYFFRSQFKETIEMLLMTAPELRCPWAKTGVQVSILFVPHGTRLRLSRSKHLLSLKSTVEEVCSKLKPKSVKLIEEPQRYISLTFFDCNFPSFFTIEIEIDAVLYKFGLTAPVGSSVEFV